MLRFDQAEKYLEKHEALKDKAGQVDRKKLVSNVSVARGQLRDPDRMIYTASRCTSRPGRRQLQSHVRHYTRKEVAYKDEGQNQAGHCEA